MPDERRINTAPQIALPLMIGDPPPPYPNEELPRYEFENHQVVTLQPLSTFAGPPSQAQGQERARNFFFGTACATGAGFDGATSLASAGLLCFLQHPPVGITALLGAGVFSGAVGFGVHSVFAHRFCKRVEESREGEE